MSNLEVLAQDNLLEGEISRQSNNVGRFYEEEIEYLDSLASTEGYSCDPCEMCCNAPEREYSREE